MTHRTLRLLVLTFAPLLLLGACGGSGGESSSPTTGRTVERAPESEDSVQLVGPAEFQQLMAENPDVPVVNVHIPYEQHIAGTDAFVAFTEIAAWPDLPDDLDAPIALYCRSGNMSGEAGRTLAALGYTNITDLEGGMKAWSTAGLPLLDEDPATS